MTKPTTSVALANSELKYFYLFLKNEISGRVNFATVWIIDRIF